jgi:hypothetical protein
MKDKGSFIHSSPHVKNEDLTPNFQTGKKAGIVLILETMKDRKYWVRLNTTIEHFNLPIDTWSIGNTSY